MKHLTLATLNTEFLPIQSTASVFTGAPIISTGGLDTSPPHKITQEEEPVKRMNDCLASLGGRKR